MLMGCVGCWWGVCGCVWGVYVVCVRCVYEYSERVFLDIFPQCVSGVHGVCGVCVGCVYIVCWMCVGCVCGV